MLETEFANQVSRLKKCFGEKHFNEEVIKLLWREVSPHSEAWFSRTIDRMVSSMKLAPTIADFVEQISADKEAKWQAMKRESSEDAKEFWKNTMHEDDVKMICGNISDRIRGGLSDESWQQFKNILPKK